ncbi:transcription antitermination factor NusB [Patescibacteria group bacterium]|nr:transcription antitermination factor NusB [Patescibacteria group bacterium]
MKKKNDPRHLKRAKLLKIIFSWQFRSEKKPAKCAQNIIANLPKIDRLIEKSAPDRPIKQINRVDLSILRLAIYELVVEKETPLKVVIDEAVELGKEYGSDSSASFINGALGKLVEIKHLKT